MIFIRLSNVDMTKNNSEKPQIQPYEFTQLYCEKKAIIQELGKSDFIEFLNWIENVNTWKKKEGWKRLIDEWFNKYSNEAIMRLFDMFIKFKNSKWQWYAYEKILNEAKSAFRTEIYWENIVRPLFGYYGNYLKYLKRKRIGSDLEKTVKSKTEKANKLKQNNKQKVAETLEAEEPKNDGLNIDNGKTSPKRKEPIQLTIQFPEDDWEAENIEKKEDDDPNMDELYKDDDDDYEYDWQKRNNR